jgi:uncharacterized protein YmfQ (DUF2313 family)
MLTRTTAPDYQHLQQRLLPRGLIWLAALSPRLHALLLGMAAELSRVHNRKLDLLDEMDPRTTTDMIDAWERALGLPDPCVQPPPSTLAERREAAHAKYIASGGQSRAYFIALALTALGLTITIEEPRPFRVDLEGIGDALYGWETTYFEAGAGGGLGRMLDPLRTDGWAHSWIVRVAGAPALDYFETGDEGAGDPLVAWRNPLLECLFSRLKPAHTNVYFYYGT